MKKTLLFCIISFSFLSINAQGLSVQISTIDESCIPGNDGSATASPSGGRQPYTYLWSNNSSNPTISGLSTGTYFVTVTDALANSQSGVAIINAPPPLVINQIITPPSCPGLSDGSISTTVSSGTPPYTYMWSGGLFGPNPTNVAAGSYALTIIDALGCSGNIIIPVPNPPAIDTTVSQNGLLLTANQANANYQWLEFVNNNWNVLNGDTSQSFTATLNGIWAVEITLNRCIDTSETISTLTIGLNEDETSQINLFELFPNPTNGKLFINGNKVGERLRIFDLSGKVVLEDLLSSTTNSLNLQHLEKGIYFIEINQLRKKLVLVE